MTKYRWIDTPKRLNEERIKNAIKAAINAPIVDPVQINVWNKEELNRYDKRIRDKRRLVGSYLK